jgi:hypothetical protein
MLPIIGTTRPNAPITWSFSTAENFNMARHHILPYNTLRNLWNNLVRCFYDTQFAEARVAIRQFLMVCNSRLPHVDSLLDKLRRDQLSVVECNVLEETAVWAAWNVVDGPKNRSDDPHDTYLDRFTFGVTKEEFDRMDVIEGLYGAFEHFNRLVQPTAGDLRILAETLKLARLTLALVECPIPFRPDMWEREADGRWRKRRSGEQFLKAGAR